MEKQTRAEYMKERYRKWKERAIDYSEANVLSVVRKKV